MGQQPGFYLGADFSIAARLYPGGRVHGGKYFWFLPSGRYSAAGVISQITARLSKEVIAIQAKRRVGSQWCCEQV